MVRKQTSLPKYDNFYIDNTSFPTSVQMLLQPVQLEDEGIYRCNPFRAGSAVDYNVAVEVVGVLNTIYGADKISELTVNETQPYSLTCSVTGARTASGLTLDWSFVEGRGVTTSENNTEDNRLKDYSNTATYIPHRNDESITCSSSGYMAEGVDSDALSATVMLTVQYPPESCSVEAFTIGGDCRNVQLQCTGCIAEPTEITSCSFSHVDSRSTTPILGNDCSSVMTTVEVSTTPYMFTCKGTNGAGMGATSSPVSYTCTSVLPQCIIIVTPTEGECRTVQLDCSCFAVSDVRGCAFFADSHPLVTNGSCSVDVIVQYDSLTRFACQGTSDDGTGPTSVSASYTCMPTAKTTDSPQLREASACTGPIAGLAVESVIVLILAGIIGWLIVRGSAKKKSLNDVHGTTNASHEHNGTENSAYMDLQERHQSSDEENHSFIIPVRNIKTVSVFPGHGLMTYKKAILTTSSGTRDVVLKSTSDDAPVKIEKIWSAEISALQILPENTSIVKIIGCCKSVTSLLLVEFVNGGNLTKHLTENFSSQKIHQYGNTKTRRFEVPESGKVENLPRYALDVARGLRFLLTSKFIHPALRAEKVLVELSGKCKLYDFFSAERAKELTSLLWVKSVPYQWMPPEYLFLESVAAAGDIWSFGVLMWEIFSYGSQPYPGKDRSAVEKCVRQKERLEMPRNCPGAVWQLMNRCWDQSTDTRPRIEEVVSKLAAMCHDDKEYDEIKNNKTTV